MLVIVNYGVGNLGSIKNACAKVGIDAIVSDRTADLDAASHLVLPGVGSFDNGMEALRGSGLLDALEQRVLGDGVPVLGICLGMQMMGRASEEGSSPGLGWVPADSVRLPALDGDTELKVPHMGWSPVGATAGSPLFEGLGREPSFYFLHSYEIRCDDPADVVATSRYGTSFHCAIGRRNIHGVQFHPEKSHTAGRRLLRSFAESA